MSGARKKDPGNKKTERFQIVITPNEVKKLGGRLKVYDIIQNEIINQLSKS